MFLILFLTACSSTQKPQIINDPVIITKYVYELPPESMLVSCLPDKPATKKFKDIITTQNAALLQCETQMQILRDWRNDKVLKMNGSEK